MQIESADSASWNIAEGQRNEQPILIRYRPDLDYLFGNEKYSQRLTIFWDYPQEDSSGLPSSSQMDSMRDFEDTVVNTLDYDRLAIFVFSYTHSGTREWHFYVSDIVKVGSRINEALSSYSKLPIGLQVVDDPLWEKLNEVYAYCRQERA